MSTSKTDACACAFLPNYVSQGYLHRAIVSHPIQSRRAPGDGHDFMWYKLTEFTLSLPLCIGFLTTSVSTFMALTLVLEALTAWSWWNSPLGPGYTIHAREHFMVNVVCSRGVASQKVSACSTPYKARVPTHPLCQAVAGGLLLLCQLGFGKYTADNLRAKKDK